MFTLDKPSTSTFHYLTCSGFLSYFSAGKVVDQTALVRFTWIIALNVILHYRCCTFHRHQLYFPSLSAVELLVHEP